MDKNIGAAGESQWQRDSAASASKFLGSLVQINSIAIDISGASEEIKSPVHGHFSIRGYVAGMRRKDWNTCLPFANSDTRDNVDDLPPLSVPTFRWWRCSSCIPDDLIPSVKRKDEPVVASKSDIDPVAKVGSFDHKDAEIGDLIEDITNSNPCHNKDHKATTTCKKDETDMPHNASSGNNDASRELLCKRKRKLRSLADLMVEEKKSNSDNPNTNSNSPSSSGVQAVSIETEPLLSQLAEFNAPVDIVKDSRSPQRKRKFALQEDRGLLIGTLNPSGPSKRSKGHVLDADVRTCRRLDISEHESAVDASTRLDFRVKAQLIKPKKRKVLDTGKKIRPGHVEDGMVRTRDWGTVNIAACNKNLEDDNAVSAQNNVSKMEHCVLSGKRISSLASSERPSVEEDARGYLMPPCQSKSGDGNNVKRKVANFNDETSHRYIPDLNEAFPFEQAVTQEKQLPDHNQGCNSEAAAGMSKPQTDEYAKKFSGVTSDDIPMEIVELLAKNQHERALGNSRKHETSTCTSSCAPVFTDGTPNMIDLPFPSTKGVVDMPNVTMEIPEKCRLFNSKRPEEIQFSSSTPCEQRKVQLSKPTINGVTELFWPPRREHFDLDPKKHSLQQNSNTVMDLNFSDKYGRGKTLSNTKDIERKKPLRDGTAVKKGSRRRSLDPYSNDTIPAMQLLSLMNQGINASGSSFEIDPKSNILDKYLSPCNNHPPLLKRKENQNLLAVSQSKQMKKFPGERSKKASSRSQGHVPLELENSNAIHSKGSENLVIHRTGNNIPTLSVCTLNRNPAEFSVPDARNKYTITARNLKPRKRKGFKN